MGLRDGSRVMAAWVARWVSLMWWWHHGVSGGATRWVFSSLASQFLSRLLSTLSTLYVSRLSLSFSFFLRFSFWFWTAGFTFYFLFFFFYIFFFFLDLHGLLSLGLAGWYGSWFLEGGMSYKVRGAQVFFIYFFENIPTKNFLFWGRGGPSLLRPPPESILDLM